MRRLVVMVFVLLLFAGQVWAFMPSCYTYDNSGNCSSCYQLQWLESGECVESCKYYLKSGPAAYDGHNDRCMPEGLAVQSMGPDLYVTDGNGDPEDLAVDFAASNIGPNLAWVGLGNAGTSDLTVFSLSIEGTDANLFDIVEIDFIDSNCSAPPFTLMPGDSCKVTVGFSTSNAGEKTAFLLITSDDPVEAVVDVTLTGSLLGTAQIDKPIGGCFFTELDVQR